MRPFGDNDNQSATKPAIMPPDDVQRFYQEYVDSAGENDWVASMRLYEAYKLWCKRTPKITASAAIAIRHLQVLRSSPVIVCIDTG